MGLENLLGAAAGATPWGAIAQFGVGTIQGVLGGLKAKKYQKQLENLKSPTYKQNAGIMDYYNKALQRYNVDPYSTSFYKQQQQQANRGLAAGIHALGDRRSALAGTPNLVQAYSDAALKAGVAAEDLQSQGLSQLGQAAIAKSGEDQKAFEINEMMPYETKFNLLSQRAGAANQTANAGIQNMFGGLSGGLLGGLGGVKRN